MLLVVPNSPHVSVLQFLSGKDGWRRFLNRRWRARGRVNAYGVTQTLVLVFRQRNAHGPRISNFVTDCSQQNTIDCQNVGGSIWWNLGLCQGRRSRSLILRRVCNVCQVRTAARSSDGWLIFDDGIGIIWNSGVAFAVYVVTAAAHKIAEQVEVAVVNQRLADQVLDTALAFVLESSQFLNTDFVQQLV